MLAVRALDAWCVIDSNATCSVNAWLSIFQLLLWLRCQPVALDSFSEGLSCDSWPGHGLCQLGWLCMISECRGATKWVPHQGALPAGRPEGRAEALCVCGLRVEVFLIWRQCVCCYAAFGSAAAHAGTDRLCGTCVCLLRWLQSC
jgi:hypothetical protein